MTVPINICSLVGIKWSCSLTHPTIGWGGGRIETPSDYWCFSEHISRFSHQVLRMVVTVYITRVQG